MIDKHKFSFKYENKLYNFYIDGQTMVGDNFCMLEKDLNLLANTRFNDSGYSVQDFIDKQSIIEIRNGISTYINGLIDKSSGIIDLSKYHEYVDESAHQKIASQLVGIPIKNFPISPNVLINFMSKLLGFDLCLNPSHSSELLPHFSLRIVRPNSDDNNPLHRDVWIDRLRNAINIFFPITPANKDSNLGIIPGSHMWKESEIERTVSGSSVNGKKYTVPAVVGAKYKLNFKRPIINDEQILIFSPYLIHGAAVNFTNETRVSLEMRFWKKEKNS